MTRLANYDPSTGEIAVVADVAVASGTNIFPSGATMEVAEGVEAATHYVNIVTATVVARPTVPAFPATVTVPYAFWNAAFPAGTTVTVTNEMAETASSSDPADPVDVIDGGTVEVEIAPPFPYQHRTQTVVVEDA